MKARLHRYIWAYDLQRFIPNWSEVIEVRLTRKGKYRCGNLIFREDGSLCSPTPRRCLIEHGYKPPCIDFKYLGGEEEEVGCKEQTEKN